MPGGAVGYADFQRVVNWDSEVLAQSIFALLRTGKNTIGPMYMGRYAYLMGFMKVQVNNVTVNCKWSADKGGVEEIAERSFVLGEQNLVVAQLHLPNLGPWLRIEMIPNTEVLNWRLTMVLIGSNRVHPLELIPRQPVLIDQAVTAGAAGNVSVSPSDCYAGPVRIMVDGGIQAVQHVKLEIGTVAGGWIEIDRIATTAAAQFSGNMVVPAGLWRMTIEFTAAATFTFAVTPSLTGST